MSDFRKLRRTNGGIWLTISFAFFALAICGLWTIFVTSWGFLITGCGLVPCFLFGLSYWLAQKSCKAYIGVPRKEINKSNSAKLCKITGIFELIRSFISFALTVNCVWIIFVFSNAHTVLFLFIIPLCVFFASFMIHNDESYNNFIRIKDLVKND